jgi:cellulose synthase operon protein C
MRAWCAHLVERWDSCPVPSRRPNFAVGSTLLAAPGRFWALFLIATQCLAIVCSLASSVVGAELEQLGEARRWLLRGRYEEAAEAFSKRAADQPVAAALGLARCRIATGRIDEADAVLAEAISRHDDDGRLAAERAVLALGRGRYEDALTHAQAALAKQPDQLAARWVTAELDRVHGRIEQAADGYRWLLDYDRKHPDLSSEQLLWIGRAAAQHARWSRDSRQFQDLVGRRYPDCLRRDPDFWPARYEMGLLLLEKYNEPDARAQFQAALAINPHAAEVHAALARLALQSFDLDAADASIRRALEIDGQLLMAHQLHADRLLAELRIDEALAVLQTARQLHPSDEETLGRLAAVFGALDGWQAADEDSRWRQLRNEVTERNPHCGRFFAALADSLDTMRRYPQAADFYRQAIDHLPRLMYARGRLGMILMRLGEEAEAQQLLEAAFADDPFNVRVKNMLEVLDVLQDYATLETDHFVLRYDRDENEVLAKFAAGYLEQQIYPEVVERLGYQPREKTLIQIFSRARNSSGHAWFSARMVGLPFLGTVGACAGRVVAIASPTELPVKFNWARVLRHEFVHVVNLQQTDFQIPHWYTEALAVLLEQQRRPDQWTEVLIRQAHAGQLFDLDSINRGFVRPSNHDQWTLAYCQALLYAEFIQNEFGPEKLIELLDAYGQGLTTRQAILRCFGCEQEQFEQRYQDYLQPIIAAGTRPSDRPIPQFCRTAASRRPGPGRCRGSRSFGRGIPSAARPC